MSQLTQAQQQFLFKRRFYQQIGVLVGWSFAGTAAIAWGLLYWLKPSLVSSSYVLQLIRDKQIEYVQLAELAVTGASAISGIFILIGVLAYVVASNAKKERQYLEIIDNLKPSDEH